MSYPSVDGIYMVNLSDAELAGRRLAARSACWAASPSARDGRISEAFKAYSRENSRRVWNRTPLVERAAQSLYGVAQGEQEWYDADTWRAMRAWLDGEMGALEACEAFGISLADEEAWK